MSASIRAAGSVALARGFKQTLGLGRYHAGVMRDRPFGEPAEVVIWATSGLLALLVGTGTSFLAWLALRNVPQHSLAFAAVGILGAGFVLVGLSIDQPLVRLFLVVMAAVFVLGYAVGGPAFGRLV
jgi:hypothetical protein